MLGTLLTATVDYLGSSLLFVASAASAAPSPRSSGCAASLVSQGTAGYLCIVCLLLCSRPCPAHTASTARWEERGSCRGGLHRLSRMVCSRNCFYRVQFINVEVKKRERVTTWSGQLQCSGLCKLRSSRRNCQLVSGILEKEFEMFLFKHTARAWLTKSSFMSLTI